jgi:hypothetical protein
VKKTESHRHNQEDIDISFETDIHKVNKNKHEATHVCRKLTHVFSEQLYYAIEVRDPHTHTHTPVDDSINNDLDRILIRQQVDDLHSMLDNAHSHQLLSIVPPMHHERIGQPAIRLINL